MNRDYDVFEMLQRIIDGKEITLKQILDSLIVIIKYAEDKNLSYKHRLEEVHDMLVALVQHLVKVYRAGHDDKGE